MDALPRRAALRADALARRGTRIAVLLGPTPEAARRDFDAAAAEVEGEDLVLRFDVEALLADRRSIARGALEALFSQDGPRWLRALRAAVPPGQALRPWFTRNTDLSADGAFRVATALEEGEFGAVKVLLARQDPPPVHFQGTVYEPPPAPLGERDARALLAFILGRLRDRATWFLVEGFEALLWECSPFARGFAEGFKDWWRHILEVPGGVLVVSCWRGGHERLSSFGGGLFFKAVDAALDALDAAEAEEIAGEAVEGGVDGAPVVVGAVDERGASCLTEALDPVEVARIEARRLGLPAPERRGGAQCWVAAGQALALVVVWPVDSRDPSTRLVELVGEVAAEIKEGDRGLGVEVLAPRWACGGEDEASREALSRAFGGLRWRFAGTAELLLIQAEATEG